MLTCPRCRTSLSPARTPSGLAHVCPECSGRMVGISVLRQNRVSRDFLVGLWRRAKEADARNGPLCPHCHRAMVEVEGTEVEGMEVDAAETDDGPVPPIDVCTVCHSVWFDALERDRIPGNGFPERPHAGLSLEGREALARAQAEWVGKRAREKEAAEGPRETWHYIPAYLGLPVEVSRRALTAMPTLTWSIAGLTMLLFSALELTGSLRTAIDDWAFLPAEPLRHGGLGILASFALHAGWFHALSNMYFLAVFGDDVEDDLGHWGFAALLLLGHVAGCVLHALFDPRIQVPLVGASAGISAVITYYAIAFPRARLGFLIVYYYYRFSWVSLPAIAWLVGWGLLQLWTGYHQVQGLTSISALGHIGGAAVGLIAALALRIRRRRALEDAGG